MDKVTEIITRIFKVDAAVVTPAMSPETIPSWDSMNYLLFISELERVFAIQFTIDEVMQSKNLGDLLEALKKKGVTL